MLRGTLEVDDARLVVLAGIGRRIRSRCSFHSVPASAVTVQQIQTGRFCLWLLPGTCYGPTESCSTGPINRALGRFPRVRPIGFVLVQRAA